MAPRGRQQNRAAASEHLLNSPPSFDECPMTKYNQSRFFSVHVIICTAVILGLTTVCAQYHFGSLAAAIASARGEHLLADSRARDVGVIPAGSRLAIRFTLTNLTVRPINLLGASTSCSCAIVGDLPATIGAAEAGTIQVEVTAPKECSSFSGMVTLFTDDLRHREFTLKYAGRAISLPLANAGPSD